MEHIGSSSGAEPTDLDATYNNNNSENSIELSALPTQITSIDGFFNRKRGRPPKNRFVEVYKSAQLSPQAIFTSFKLEKNDQAGATSSNFVPSTDATEERIPLRLGAGTTQTLTGQSATATATATDLTPSRNNRKRARIWATDSSNVTITNSGSGERTKNTPTVDLTERSSPIMLIYPSSFPPAAACNKSLERVSVVRAAGTFYPENASLTPAAVEQPSSVVTASDQPEDLSMRAVQHSKRMEPEKESEMAATNETESNAKLLQFKQLLELYQRQVLLPSFLAAGQLDMRLLLEQAAQQKMLLINAAAAVAATNAAAAAAATSPSAPTETTTIPNSNLIPTQIPTPAPSRVSVKRLRDQDIPLGYLKFRFNEDCNFERCGYRNHQSHFHCNRRDCHYSFCDKTRFVQHTARHERMDTLMGDDFRQYRANMRCEIRNCPYATASSSNTQMATEAPKKSSHFHCRKCDYVCTDSNKVVAHRRLHMRLDYVRSAGFRKIANNESCDSPSCTYALRHTHYHCITCDGSVLSRAQLASHRHRSGSSTSTGSANQTVRQNGAESASGSSGGNVDGLSLICGK